MTTEPDMMGVETMRDFGRKMWSPAGPRPHLLLTFAGKEDSFYCDRLVHDPRLADDEGIAPIGALTQWHPHWYDIVSPVPTQFRHMTVAWLDCPTADTPPGSSLELQRRLYMPLAAFRNIRLRLIGLVASEHGIQLRIERSKDLDRLLRVAREVMCEVYGADAPVHTPNPDRLHIALAYGRADADTATGPIDWVEPPPSRLSVDSVTYADLDTFHPEGPRWEPDTVGRVYTNYDDWKADYGGHQHVLRHGLGGGFLWPGTFD